ncbi:hypothetical protein AYB33_17425 [Leptospira santarosai]|nr:hypothetical protein AYB33_17425 [Leptospira santarosai]
MLKFTEWRFFDFGLISKKNDDFQKKVQNIFYGKSKSYLDIFYYSKTIDKASPCGLVKNISLLYALTLVSAMLFTRLDLQIALCTV